jgi:hypothetical protein
MAYLSSISTVLSPMNWAFPFIPLAVWQPINENAITIRTTDMSILLAILDSFKLSRASLKL